MRRFMPHAILVGGFITFFVLAFAANNPSLGSFFGSLQAICEDPAIYLTAIVAGSVSSNYRKFLIVTAAASAVVLPVIHFQVMAFHQEVGIVDTPEHLVYIWFVRLVGIVLLAHVVNVFRVLMTRASGRPTAQEKPNLPVQ